MEGNKFWLKGAWRIAMGLIILGAGILFFVLDPAGHQVFPKCIFHSATGYYCPGCGSQRAIHELLHLNFAASIQNNLLIIPAGLLIVYHYSRSYLNKQLHWNLPNFFGHKKTPWIVVFGILIFWILRNISVYPFIMLAPG